MTKNIFAKMADDSDDERAPVNKTKTQIKKDERKISDKPVKKVNVGKMAEGGFEVVDNSTS